MNDLACHHVSYADVLHDVSITVRPGRITALLGPSGAGKTTLLWVLAGLWKPISGKLTPGDGKLGMVFQQPGLWDHLTVEQHLRIVGADTVSTENTLTQMRLNDLRIRKPGKMSGGERQRLAIARALAIEPAWLLLDEPMAHLDGPSRLELFELLRNALRNTRAGVVLATHHADEALRLADDAVIISAGRIIQQGTARDVYRRPVNLIAAQATGPAAMLQDRIVRPEHLRFTPRDEGDATIQRCEFVGPGYIMSVVVQENVVSVCSDTPHAIRCRGSITIIDA